MLVIWHNLFLPPGSLVQLLYCSNTVQLSDGIMDGALLGAMSLKILISNSMFTVLSPATQNQTKKQCFQQQISTKILARKIRCRFFMTFKGTIWMMLVIFHITAQLLWAARLYKEKWAGGCGGRGEGKLGTILFHYLVKGRRFLPSRVPQNRITITNFDPLGSRAKCNDFNCFHLNFCTRRQTHFLSE